MQCIAPDLIGADAGATRAGCAELEGIERRHRSGARLPDRVDIAAIQRAAHVLQGTQDIHQVHQVRTRPTPVRMRTMERFAGMAARNETAVQPRDPSHLGGEFKEPRKLSSATGKCAHRTPMRL
jgi:hypothetical protein